MILCHKCSGTFEHVPELSPCECISGYPRGFEKVLTLEEAATEQAKAEIEKLSLYSSQGRSKNDPCIQSALYRLMLAMKTSPHFGHGVVQFSKL